MLILCHGWFIEEEVEVEVVLNTHLLSSIREYEVVLNTHLLSSIREYTSMMVRYIG